MRPYRSLLRQQRHAFLSKELAGDPLLLLYHVVATYYLTPLVPSLPPLWPSDYPSSGRESAGL